MLHLMSRFERESRVALTSTDRMNDDVPLDLSTVHFGRRPTLSRREEAYRFLWREIEYFVRGYKETSDGHRHIYQAIVSRRKSEQESSASIYPR